MEVKGSASGPVRQVSYVVQGPYLVLLSDKDLTVRVRSSQPFQADFVAPSGWKA